MMSENTISDSKAEELQRMDILDRVQDSKLQESQQVFVHLANVAAVAAEADQHREVA